MYFLKNNQPSLSPPTRIWYSYLSLLELKKNVQSLMSRGQ